MHGLRIGGEVDLGLQSAVAVAQKHADRVCACVGGDEVGLAVAVEVAQCHERRPDTDLYLDLGLERAVALPEQHGQAALVDLAHHEVHERVAVEISLRNGLLAGAAIDHGLRLEHAVALADQDTHVVRTRVRDRKIGLLVAIEVRHDHGAGLLTRLRVDEGAVALADEHAASRGDVDLAVAVDVSPHLGEPGRQLGRSLEPAVPIVQLQAIRHRQVEALVAVDVDELGVLPRPELHGVDAANRQRPRVCAALADEQGHARVVEADDVDLAVPRDVTREEPPERLVELAVDLVGEFRPRLLTAVHRKDVRPGDVRAEDDVGLAVAVQVREHELVAVLPAPAWQFRDALERVALAAVVHEELRVLVPTVGHRDDQVRAAIVVDLPDGHRADVGRELEHEARCEGPVPVAERHADHPEGRGAGIVPPGRQHVELAVAVEVAREPAAALQVGVRRALEREGAIAVAQRDLPAAEGHDVDLFVAVEVAGQHGIVHLRDRQARGVVEGRRRADGGRAL